MMKALKCVLSTLKLSYNEYKNIEDFVKLAKGHNEYAEDIISGFYDLYKIDVKDESFDKICSKIIQELNGTRQSVCKVIESFKLGDSKRYDDILDSIDEQLFCCADCGWWYENYEKDEENGLCADCSDLEE